MHLMIYFELNDTEIGKHYNCTQKGLKLGMVTSFDPHNMCAKVERVTKKKDALRVQTGPSLSKYECFKRKLICYKGISLSKLISTLYFLCIQYASFKDTY